MSSLRSTRQLDRGPPFLQRALRDVERKFADIEVVGELVMQLTTVIADLIKPAAKLPY